MPRTVAGLRRGAMGRTTAGPVGYHERGRCASHHDPPAPGSRGAEGSGTALVSSGVAEKFTDLAISDSTNVDLPSGSWALMLLDGI